MSHLLHFCPMCDDCQQDARQHVSVNDDVHQSFIVQTHGIKLKRSQVESSSLKM